MSFGWGNRKCTAPKIKPNKGKRTFRTTWLNKKKKEYLRLDRLRDLKNIYIARAYKRIDFRWWSG